MLAKVPLWVYNSHSSIHNFLLYLLLLHCGYLAAAFVSWLKLLCSFTILLQLFANVFYMLVLHDVFFCILQLMSHAFIPDLNSSLLLYLLFWLLPQIAGFFSPVHSSKCRWHRYTKSFNSYSITSQSHQLLDW